MARVIAAYDVVNHSDPTDRHRIDIPEAKRSQSNWYADKVFDGLLQRIDCEHWYIATVYEDAT